ncbi:zinc-ribbon domain-containing protein [Microbacterium sp. KSW4-11]|uniref:Zinc-ribbon domain-containing protein n=1 Tax=Microbacterium gawkjiense TaxID=3067309 RepID=A0ABU3G7Y5_9MICO|nr:zinc-ribbon domain-containing protein [Microbacterium sp. KSW4-11]MDT3315561.1 zinc-ribbon domain-containing protein [Microbacterium sp. KSW4-11]
MTEPVRWWWQRRQFSRGVDVPYPVGTYRSAWAAYPELVRQYHPDLNEGISLSQIPPAADVLLCWECTAGHRFAATPSEQRERPGRVRRRSAWCPECSALAAPRPVKVVQRVDAAQVLAAVDRAKAVRMPVAPAPAPRSKRAAPAVCEKTPDLPVGEPFVSECAPRPASAAEGRLRQQLSQALLFTEGMTAVRVGRPFFRHREVWPDILLPELRVAIEYDTPGRHGLEHVGKREASDRRKDALLRAAGWEVVRVRTGGLEPLGPHDVVLRTAGTKTVPAIIDALRGIRGDMVVDAYRR